MLEPLILLQYNRMRNRMKPKPVISYASDQQETAALLSDAQIMQALWNVQGGNEEGCREFEPKGD